MKPSTYRNAAEKALRRVWDPSRLKRGDRLLAMAIKRGLFRKCAS